MPCCSLKHEISRAVRCSEYRLFHMVMLCMIYTAQKVKKKVTDI